MPETIIPPRRPFSAFLLKRIPTVTGVKMTSAPGAIIFLSEASVEIATHLYELGGSPSRIFSN
jgi:hypothetical protein